MGRGGGGGGMREAKSVTSGYYDTNVFQTVNESVLVPSPLLFSLCIIRLSFFLSFLFLFFCFSVCGFHLFFFFLSPRLLHSLLFLFLLLHRILPVVVSSSLLHSLCVWFFFLCFFVRLFLFGFSLDGLLCFLHLSYFSFPCLIVCSAFPFFLFFFIFFVVIFFFSSPSIHTLFPSPYLSFLLLQKCCCLSTPLSVAPPPPLHTSTPVRALCIGDDEDGSRW